MTEKGNKENFDPYLVEILKEMCNRVGANYDAFDFTPDDWYEQYSWAKEEESDFKEWMVDYLYNNAKARRALTYCGKNKKCLRKAVDFCIFNYGWKYSET